MKTVVNIRVNGVEQSHEVEPRTLLVHFLRDCCKLTGTHVGCETTICGACTVLFEGKAVKSCTSLAVQADAFGAMDGRRHCVRPGMTGYWQIAGGNGLTYAEMVKLDLAYIQNWSLWLDLRLLVRTVPALLTSQGRW